MALSLFESLSSPLPPWASCGLVATALFPALYYLYYRRVPYPPGPRATFPFVGNILQIPAQFSWLKFSECKKQYGASLIYVHSTISLSVCPGDVIYFHGFGNNVVVLNSLEAITELFEKRAQNYSHRPQFTFLCELLGTGRVCPRILASDRIN